MKIATTPVDVGAIVRQLLEQGYAPVDIRKQLQARGLTWRYSYTGVRPDGRRAVHQGVRESLRRMKQGNLCMRACGRQRVTGTEYCQECLREKWGPQA